MIENSNYMLQARSDCFISYFQSDHLAALNPLQKALMKQRMLNARSVAYKGSFSSGAKKRMSRAIDIMIQTTRVIYGINEVTGKRQRHFLSYITLTIPATGDLTADQGYNGLLKHFLQWLRRTKKVNTYIWKAEFQKRGQLHYHITTPAWIHYQEIKDKWNNLLKNVGMMDEYYKSQGHNDANSTDVHEVRNIGGIAGYLKKEYYKSIQNKETIGKIWDCSENLKSYGYYTVLFDMGLYYSSNDLISQNKIKEIELEQCRVIKTQKGKDWDQLLTLQQLREYDIWKVQVRNHKEVVKLNEKKKKQKDAGIPTYKS